MPNTPAQFITQRQPDSDYGSSLYAVTADTVLRVSGNSNGRTPETFIRKRAIVYIKDGGESGQPSLGAFPREGEHDGNDIVEILDGALSPDAPPPQWQAEHGVPWSVAVAEIEAAREYVKNNPGVNRASRDVGQQAFTPD